MKNYVVAAALTAICVGMVACNDSATSKSEGDSTMNSGDSNMGRMDNTNNTTPSATVVSTPYTKEDSMFASKAAVGGLMEVAAGQVIQQQSGNDRVKAVASMIASDHQKANADLAALATAHGLSLPTTLPADKQSHVDAMAKMKGAALDKHYIQMMRDDHKKDIAEFEKQANAGADGELKSFASNTLVRLKVHRDSVEALSKVKM